MVFTKKCELYMFEDLGYAGNSFVSRSVDWGVYSTEVLFAFCNSIAMLYLADLLLTTLRGAEGLDKIFEVGRGSACAGLTIRKKSSKFCFAVA